MIVITGASDGIGKAIALELSKCKYDLILLGRDINKLTSVKDECISLGSSAVEIFNFDLKDISAIKQFASDLKSKGLEIQGLINNAGIWQKKADLDAIPEEELLSVINTNLTGLILLTQKLLPMLRESDPSFIINISSRSGYSASAGQSVYSATKYGVKGFTEVIREDLKDTSVRVCGVYQGGVNTQMFNKAGEDMPEEKLSTFIPTEELAKVITFLIQRPKSIWIPEIKVEVK